MKRILLTMALAALAAAPLTAAEPTAPMSCCRNGGVERAVANVDNGVRITMTAKDPKTVAALHETSASCCKGCPMAAEGVTRTVENTASGVVITATAKDAELVKKLQALAASMSAAGDAKGCCRGKGDAKASGACPHAGADATSPGAAGKCPYAGGDAKQS